MPVDGLSLPEDVRTNVSASGRLAYLALREADCSLTVQEIIERTGISDYQARIVLEDLTDAGHAERHRHAVDGRRVKYSAAEEAVA